MKRRREEKNFVKPKRRSYSLSISIKFRHFSTSSFLYSAEAVLVWGQSLVIHLYKYAEITCVGREILRNKKYRKYLQRGASRWSGIGGWGDFESGEWSGDARGCARF